MSVDLYCDGHLDNAGQPTHERWVLARWKRLDGKWAATKRVSEPGEELRLIKGSVTQLLDGADRLERFEWSRAAPLPEWKTDDARTRYKFACPVCSLSLVRKKTPAVEELLTAILDAVDKAGESELSLRALTATLK